MAYKAFLKISPDSDLLKAILASVEAYKQTDQWKRDGGQFIPHPSTWLNQRRWEDDLGTLKRESTSERIQRIVDRTKQVR